MKYFILVIALCYAPFAFADTCQGVTDLDTLDALGSNNCVLVGTFQSSFDFVGKVNKCYPSMQLCNYFYADGQQLTWREMLNLPGPDMPAADIQISGYSATDHGLLLGTGDVFEFRYSPSTSNGSSGQALIADLPPVSTGALAFEVVAVNTNGGYPSKPTIGYMKTAFAGLIQFETLQK